MLVNKKFHHRTRLHNYLFLILFFAISGSLAFLSTRYHFDADWTASGRNSLSPASIALLGELPDPISITSYATEDPRLRRAVSDVIKRYQRHKPELNFHFINPDLVPDTIRQLGISGNGELLIEYQGRRENLKDITEAGITNTLQRLARSGERWLVFLSGHGERNPEGEANHDLGNWAGQLTTKGFQVQTHNLASQPLLPDNTRVLVIASPQVELLPGEISIIQDYITGGGNLLWLTDPDSRYGLSILKNTFGVELEDGVIVDPSTQLLGINDPRFTVVADYPQHDITATFDTITLFPQAVGLRTMIPQLKLQKWKSQVLLASHQRSWSETGALSGSIQLDPATDTPGPLTLGIAQQRKLGNSDSETERQQRIVIVGDGDFLANAYLGNGGNLMLGFNIINWLAHDDRFIDIPTKIYPDKNLQLSSTAQVVISAGFLLVIPLLLFVAGFLIWWRRRQR